MTLLAHPPKSSRRNHLTGSDWIEAALEVLLEDGIEAVQITVLSKRLNVTRGSFYWHFDSREALLDALLAEWRVRNTGVMVEAIAETETLDHGILALFSVWTDHTRFDPRLDQAIRDWARYSGSLLDKVQAEDQARVTAIADFFKRHEYEATEAFIRARIIYFTQLSYYALNVQEPMADRLSYLSAYFLGFTGRKIDPDIAQSQIEKFLKEDETK